MVAHDRLFRWVWAFVLVLAVLQILSMVLGASISLLYVFRILGTFVVLPLAVFITLTRPQFAGRVLFALFVLDIQFFVGMAAVNLVFLYGCVCVPTHIIRCVISKEPVFERKIWQPALVGYLLLAVVRYLRDPALPTFGEGEGSGFRMYFMFFATFIPFLIIPPFFNRKSLKNFPQFLMFAALAATGLRLGVALMPPSIVQRLLLTSSDMTYLMQGRFSLLSVSSSCLLVSAMTLLFFSPRTHSVSARLGYALAMALGTVGLLLTGTRALVVAAAGALLYVMIARGWWLRTFFCLVLLGFAISYIAGVNVNESSALAPVVRSLSVKVFGMDRGRVSTNPYLTQATLEWRMELWTRALASIRRYPLLGRGFSGRYSESVRSRAGSYAYYYQWVTEGELDAGATHNLFIGPFLTFGIPAGLLFLLYVGQRLRAVLRLCRSVDRNNELYRMTRLIGVWTVFILGANLTSGGTVATIPMLIFALSHVTERVVKQAEGDETVPGVETEQPSLEAPSLDPLS